MQGWSNASLRDSSHVDWTQDLHVFWKLISTSEQKCFNLLLPLHPHLQRMPLWDFQVREILIWTEVLVLLFCFNSWFTFETTPDSMPIHNTKADTIKLCVTPDFWKSWGSGHGAFLGCVGNEVAAQQQLQLHLCSLELQTTTRPCSECWGCFFAWTGWKAPAQITDQAQTAPVPSAVWRSSEIPCPCL